MNRPRLSSGNKMSTQSVGAARRRWWVAVASLLAVIAIGWYLLWDRDVRLSDTGYELSKALYAACNLEDTSRLAAFEKAVAQYELSDQERSKMMPILTLAKDGQWRDAAVRARTLLESQELP